MKSIRPETHLPVLCLTLKHHRVLSFADLSRIVILDLLDVLLGLDALSLGKGSLVSLSSSVGEEVRADRLNGTLGSR